MVYHVSSSYEMQFIDSFELARRCSQENGTCPREEYNVGGQGYQTGCHLDDGSMFSVAGPGSGIKARQMSVVEEDDEFRSLE